MIKPNRLKHGDTIAVVSPSGGAASAFPRALQVTGGHWIWTASLRFVFMFPVLLVLVLPEKRYKKVLLEIRKNTIGWFVWSMVGFGIFYSFLCIASSTGPSWMIASMWQLTIVAGILLTPLFRRTTQAGSARHRIPLKQLLISLLIISGVVLVQYQTDSEISVHATILPLLFITLSAFSYPLGNRKMMELVPDSMSTTERIFGMTVCTLPFWFALMFIGLLNNIIPTIDQLKQTVIVAVSSGIIATVLFFKATEMVKTDVRKLAIIESTQAGEVVFALLMGIMLFNDKKPSLVALIGIVIILSGMILNSIKFQDKPV